MLNALKKSYQEGVGLLASHNNRRLPFGRTFDAEIVVDNVNDSDVDTLYIDHYIVTHTIDEEGNKLPLRTEINGMTTQDIANHIDVGHTFDTSIGFTISKPTCSICKHDIRDYNECTHMPGYMYDVQDGDEVVKQRCDIIAEDGEGLENSLVYAGAVNRAIIQQTSGNEAYSQSVQEDVTNSELQLYNVDDIKSVPLGSQLLCRMSKGNLELFTVTPDRLSKQELMNIKESEQMAENNGVTQTPNEPTQQLLSTVAEPLRSAISLEEYNKVVGEKEELSKKVEEYDSQLGDLTDQLNAANERVAELSAKAELADKFTKDLVENVVKAGIQARGNNFNEERYRKYAETLSVDELKEELQAFEGEFPGTVKAAQVTSKSAELDRQVDTVELSKQELRELAAKNAMERYQKSGGDLEQLTVEELSKLENPSN